MKKKMMMTLMRGCHSRRSRGRTTRATRKPESRSQTKRSLARVRNRRTAKQVRFCVHWLFDLFLVLMRIQESRACFMCTCVYIDSLKSTPNFAIRLWTTSRAALKINDRTFRFPEFHPLHTPLHTHSPPVTLKNSTDCAKPRPCERKVDSNQIFEIAKTPSTL